MIPATKLGDSFWYQSSREIFLTLALFLFETKGIATLSEIHDLSKQESFFEWLARLSFSHEPQADEPYGILALMDEFGNMACINKLKDGLSFLRSYRMPCIIIVQYLAQITSVYGRDDVKGFLNSKIKIAFALNDMEDAQFFSKSLGSRTVKITSSSVSTGHGDNPGSCSENFSFQARALMNPDEIMQLSAKKSLILMEAKNPIKANKCYWFKDFYYKRYVSHL